MKKWILPTAGAICTVAIIAMILSLSVFNKRSEYIPPEFDATAVSGVPIVSEDLGYSEIYKDGMNYKAWVCGKVKVIDNSSQVYFTSDKDNNALLKLRILDENDNILAETGLIKPGEYIKSINFIKTVQDGQKIKMKIMGYEANTYYSAGSVTLNTTITKGE